MEQRKLIRLGNSSYAIALPKKWVEKSGLKKGDSLSLLQNSNGEIILTPNPKSFSERKISINIENKSEEDITKEITAAYVNGYKFFYFIGRNNKKIKKFIKSVLSEFLSIEILEENEDSVIAKDMFNIDEQHQEKFVRRMDNNVREMFDIVFEAVNKKQVSKNNLQELLSIDKDINKFHMLITKVMLNGVDNPTFLSENKTESIDLYNNWWVSSNIEHIGDDLKRILRPINKENMENISKLMPLLKEIRENYENCMESYYKADKSIAIEAMRQGPVIKEKVGKFFSEEKTLMFTMLSQLDNMRYSAYQIAKMILYLRI